MELDQRQLRNAFGTFATGVTVVTTLGEDGQPKAMTANSFSSLSLDPPLLLWCPGKSADCYDDFRRARRFAVHVLTAGQQAASNRFATKAIDKFAGVGWSTGDGGLPLLDDFLTRFEYETEAVHPGGDHVIMVGRVVRISVAGEAGAPLVFYGGKYRALSEAA